MPDFSQLTERQMEIYEFIREKIERRGYGPTVREIGLAAGERGTPGRGRSVGRRAGAGLLGALERERRGRVATAPPRVVARRIRSSKSHAKRHSARVLHKKLNRTRLRDFRKRRSCAVRLKVEGARAPACWQRHFVLRPMVSRAR